MTQIASDNLAYNINQAPQKWYKKRWGRAIMALIFLIILLFVLLAAAVFGLVQNIQNNKNIVQNINAIDRSFFDNAQKSPQRQLAEKMDRPQFGNPKAPLVIVEFADFQCTHSKQEFSIIREFINKYKNDLLFIYRQYPVINDDSAVIGEASLCAEEQGKFWQMHDRLFSRSEENITPETVRLAAQLSGVDLKKFDECVKSRKFQGKVMEDAQDGFNLDVRGTPTFFINGKKVEGAVPSEIWEQIMAKAKEIMGSK